MKLQTKITYLFILFIVIEPLHVYATDVTGIEVETSYSYEDDYDLSVDETVYITVNLGVDCKFIDIDNVIDDCYLLLQLDDKQAKATLTQYSTDWMSFEYTVQPQDYVDVLSLADPMITLPIGAQVLRMSDDTAVDLTLPTVELSGPYGETIKIDGIPPKLVHIDSLNASGSYETDDLLILTAKFDEPIIGDSSGYMSIVIDEETGYTSIADITTISNGEPDTLYFRFYVGFDCKTSELTLKTMDGLYCYINDNAGNMAPHVEGYITLPSEGSPDSLSARKTLALNMDAGGLETTPITGGGTSSTDTTTETEETSDANTDETNNRDSPPYTIIAAAGIAAVGAGAYIVTKQRTPKAKKPSYHERNMTPLEQKGLEKSLINDMENRPPVDKVADPEISELSNRKSSEKKSEPPSVQDDDWNIEPEDQILVNTEDGFLDETQLGPDKGYKVRDMTDTEITGEKTARESTTVSKEKTPDQEITEADQVTDLENAFDETYSRGDSWTEKPRKLEGQVTYVQQSSDSEKPDLKLSDEDKSKLTKPYHVGKDIDSPLSIDDAVNAVESKLHPGQESKKETSDEPYKETSKQDESSKELAIQKQKLLKNIQNKVEKQLNPIKTSQEKTVPEDLYKYLKNQYVEMVFKGLEKNTSTSPPNNTKNIEDYSIEEFNNYILEKTMEIGKTVFKNPPFTIEKIKQTTKPKKTQENTHRLYLNDDDLSFFMFKAYGWLYGKKLEQVIEEYYAKNEKKTWNAIDGGARTGDLWEWDSIDLAWGEQDYLEDVQREQLKKLYPDWDFKEQGDPWKWDPEKKEWTYRGDKPAYREVENTKYISVPFIG